MQFNKLESYGEKIKKLSTKYSAKISQTGGCKSGKNDIVGNPRTPISRLTPVPVSEVANLIKKIK
jgi:hypothetical protein